MPDGYQDAGVGSGEYPLSEAARLTGVGPRQARRWLVGGADPVLIPQFPWLDGERPIGFLNLIEMAMIRDLREAGVTWPTIRRLIARARTELSEPHPFAVSRIHTDGRGAFLETARETRDARLMNLVDGNFAMLDVLKASFTRTVTYDAGRASRNRG